MSFHNRFMFLLCSLSVGCGCAVTPSISSTIPTGQWRGHGSVVCEGWQGSPGTQDNPLPDLQREYDTTLSIDKQVLDGHECVVIRIASQGGYEDDHDVHVKVALTLLKKAEGGAMLYRVVDVRFGPRDDGPLSWSSGAWQVGASYAVHHGVGWLQIRYAGGFVDFLRFYRDTVEKTGVYSQENGLIHWTERLVRE